MNVTPWEKCALLSWLHGKNGFVTVTKLGTTNKFFVAETKNFAAATKRFVDRTKHFVVVTKYFCCTYFNKWFCWYNKTFYTVYVVSFCCLLWQLFRSRKSVNQNITCCWGWLGGLEVSIYLSLRPMSIKIQLELQSILHFHLKRSHEIQWLDFRGIEK